MMIIVKIVATLVTVGVCVSWSALQEVIEKEEEKSVKYFLKALGAIVIILWGIWGG